MRFAVGGLLVGCACLALSACGGALGKQYEYEEQLYLGVDGSATAIVSTSLNALVVLRGAALDLDAAARWEREDVRRVFEAAGCQVSSVGQFWRREGRRFVQIRLDVEDVRTLGRCGMLGWSSYELSTTAPVDGEAGGEQLRFVQKVGPSADTAGDAGQSADAKWNGQELVAFKIHLPSRIAFHNVRRLEDGAPGRAARGNILTWEQPLADRRRGVPLRIEAVFGSTSILYRTLTLFAVAMAAAVAVLALSIWLTVRRGRKNAAR
jgi:hypothetical protein